MGNGFLHTSLRPVGKLTGRLSGMFAVRESATEGFLLPTFLFLKKKRTKKNRRFPKKPAVIGLVVKMM